MAIELDIAVDDVMRPWPGHRVLHLGRSIATFHTIEDACREHGADGGVFLAALRGHPADGSMC